MKKFYALFILFIALSGMAHSQCTPVSCISTLPAYGGLCDSVVTDGQVNTPYFDFISFHVTNNCVDAGILDPSQAGVGIRITSLHDFVFSGLPGGLSGQTNQVSYVPNANGCAALTGTPTEAGVFEGTVSFLVNVNAWILSATCGGIFPPIPQNDQPLSGAINVTILPDAAFSGLDPQYCENDADVTLTATGTQGGTFSGPGVTGNTFSPSAAGPGTHDITYSVSAQQGTAVGPASNSSTITVTVNAATNIYYADTDGDNFGDPASSVLDCDPPAGFVADSTDCDDSNNAIYPGAPEIPDNGIDEDCDGFDLTTGLVSLELGGINLYPNPGTDFLFIETGVETRNLNVNIYSVYGTLVLQNQITSTKSKTGTDISKLPSGIYFISLKNEEVNTLVKWIKY